MMCTSAHSTVMFTCGWVWHTGPACWPICPILGFLGANFTPMNRRAKFDTASLSLAEKSAFAEKSTFAEKSAFVQTHKKQKAVTDISTGICG